MDQDLRLVGTWKLLSCKHRLTNGETWHPYGKSPSGLLVYTPDGYMSVAIMAAERTHFQTKGIFEGTDEEAAHGFKTYLHYGATYEIDGNFVRHHVIISLFPNWVGTTQERAFQLEKNRIEFSTKPFVHDGQEQTAHLVWERVS